MTFKHHSSYQKLCITLLAIFVLCDCSDPVTPEFKFKEGLVYIDALASTAPGASYATLTRSVREFGVNKNTFISGAAVTFVNTTSGTTVILIEDEELYVPPADFAAGFGETWELRVILEDGTEYRSLPETVQKAVEISDLEVTYNPELIFNESLGFIPGHEISASFDDPGNEDNFYYWRYRTFERLVNCRICFTAFYRNGECVKANVETDNSPVNEYYTYGCEEPCWRIRFSDQINIFSDEFSDGTTTTALPVANIILYSKRNILVELQQFNITPAAYRYYKTLKDIIDNNTGFNSPLPAALVGNLFNPSDGEEFVLGRFTAAATTVKPIFIERIFVGEDPLEDEYTSQAEGLEAPAPVVLTAPCITSRFRTSTRPDGWIDQ